MTKDTVRKMAVEMDLPAVKRKESRKICFIADNDYARFLREQLNTQSTPGNIVDKHGKVLGKHNGIIDYTIGQRKGMGIASAKPLFVVEIDAQTNTVVVGGKEDVYAREFIATDVNWMTVESLIEPMTLKVRIRYLHHESEAVIAPFENKKVLVKFAEPQMAVTPGQSAVFYDGDLVVGGGTIERVLH
jgi:tRNA-specific 2-thiouridylase